MKLFSLGFIINITLRLSILYFLGETLLFPDDPRFAGKAIPIRNIIIVLTLSLLFPLFHFIKKRWKTLPAGRQEYPYWLDNLYLSIFWLDMAGNSFNLYNTYFYFDLIPHFHGTGAIAIVFLGAFGLSPIISFLSANVIHVLLEAQELLTDIFLQTRNVRGFSDTVNDVVVGVLGTVLYVFIYLLIRRRSVNRSNQKMKVT